MKLKEIEISRLNNEGEGIGKIDNVISFVKGALPTEKVKVEIDKVNKNYINASLVNIIKKSDNRVNPICPYYLNCGGCSLMHLSYKKQLEFKIEKVKSIFKKITKENIKIKNIFHDNELYYRNKAVFKIKDNKIGYYKEKTNEIVDIDKCYIVNEKINLTLKQIKEFIKKYHNHYIKSIMIRVINNNIMVKIDNLNESYLDQLIKNINEVYSIYIDDKLVYGLESLEENIDGLKFYVSPSSFFQVNKTIYEKMYKYVIDNIEKNETSLDLYSGTGTISILLSTKCKKVIGIEVVKESVKDSIQNLKLNNINNVEFICDKVENKINTLKNMNIDNIILDPPRSGSDKKTIRNILDINPKKIIYISCNPITLARDYNLLKEKYIINKINVFDMFPNTYHVETVMVLERKN